jgi:hypothetical protein
MTKALRLNYATMRYEETPDLVVVSDAVTLATSGGIPRADAYGKIDADWIPALPLVDLPVAADGEVSSTKVVRADDSRLGNPTVGGDLSGTAASATVARVQGRSVASAAPSDGDALVWNDTLNRWEPGAVGAGGVLTIAEIDGTPSVVGVTTIRVANGSLSDDGGGSVTITTGGGGGGEGPGGLLYLFSTYR